MNQQPRNICPHCGKTTGTLNPYRKGQRITHFVCGLHHDKCVSHLRQRIEALEAQVKALINGAMGQP